MSNTKDFNIFEFKKTPRFFQLGKSKEVLNLLNDSPITGKVISASVLHGACKKIRVQVYVDAPLKEVSELVTKLEDLGLVVRHNLEVPPISPSTGISIISAVDTGEVYLNSQDVIVHLTKIKNITGCEHVEKFIQDIITIQIEDNHGKKEG